MQFFSNIREHFSMSRKEMCKYIDDLVSTNYELVMENNNFRNDYLATENSMLKEENSKLDNLCFELTQENGNADKEIEWLKVENEELEAENLYLKNYNKMLENANFNLKLTKDILETKVEDLSQQQEINDILETDKPLASNELLVDRIDKLEEKNETYREVVNAICVKYDIPNNSLAEIIETVQSNKSQQLEKSL